MAWPDDGDLEVTVGAAFGADVTAAPSTWSFTDLSSRLIGEPIQITRGVLVGNGTRRTASATVTLLNDDGWLTPELPTSPYAPYVDLGTPMSVAVRTRTTPDIVDTFTRTVASGWGTSDSGQGWLGTTGSAVASGKATITFSSTNQIRTTRVPHTRRDMDITFDVSVPASITGASVLAGPGLRANNSLTNYLWAAVEFTSTGTIRWVLDATVASSTTTYGPFTQPGLTYTAGTVIRARVQLVGNRLRARAWLAAGSEPTTWVLDQTLTVLQTAGTHLAMLAWCQSVSSPAVPFAVSFDNLTVQQPKYARIEGFIADVRPSFIPVGDGTFHSVVQVDIGGVQSRLERKTADDLSPMRRSLEKATVPPIAYWPLEDQQQATSAASAFPEQPPMVATGPVVFGVDPGDIDDPNVSKFGTALLASVAAGAKLSAPVPLSASTSWTVGVEAFLFTAAIGGGITEVRLLEWFTPSGTFQRWALIGTLTGHTVRAYDDVNGTTTDVISYANNFGGLINHAVSATQSGGNINLQLMFNSNPLAAGSIAGTSAPVTKVTVNPDQRNTTASTSPIGIRFLVCHVTVHAAVVQVLPYYNDALLGPSPVQLRADRGWAYEAAHRRFARLCTEEKVPYRVLGAPYTSGFTQLNAQSPGQFVQLLTDAVESESGGLIWEGEFGFVHRPRSDRYNPAVALTVNMATYKRSGSQDKAEVLVPKLGNRGPNFWTVERRNGSSATYAAPKALRDRRGTVSDKATLDILYDSDAGPHAQWRTHLNVDGSGPNYPGMKLDLAANPELVDDWLLCEIGSRVQRTNQPTIAGLGTIDQIIDGISETIVPRTQSGGPGWTATVDTSPASVWETGIWDSATSLWIPANTVLSVGVNTTATSWSMNSNGEPWITGVVSLRAQLGLEQILITNITGAGSSWTFTVTRSVNSVVAAHTAGTEKLTLLDAGTWSL